MDALTPQQRAAVQQEVEQAARVRRVLEGAGRARRGPIPAVEVPYFAHMQLRVDGELRDVFLGYRTYLDNGVTIVDWRTAPVAQVFFNYGEGEEYEHEVDGRWLQGEVECRRVVTFSEGELVAVITPDATLRRGDEGQWSLDEGHRGDRMTGGSAGAGVARLVGTGEAGRRMPVVTALLDPEQYAALRRDVGRPLLVLGGAGCGKTTVALHRLAHLAWHDPQRFHVREMIAIVPERGLVKLTRALLREMGMAGVVVETFDDWVERQGKALLRGLPRTVCPSTPFKVSRFKRHPALRQVLPEFLEELASDMAERLESDLRARGVIREVFSNAGARGLSLRARMNRAERRLARRASTARVRAIRSRFKRERRSLGRLADDRIRLLLDRRLLNRAVDASDGELDPSMAEAVIRHTAAQLSARSEEAHAGVDPERLVGVDQRGVDERTPAEVAGTIDVEDYALLFEVMFLKAGSMKTGKGRPPSYSHMMVDEAQDLAPVELAVLGRTLRPDAALTVAGDQAQGVDPAVVFQGWETVLNTLGVEGTEPVHLRTTYRCPRPIAELGQQVLGPLAPDVPPEAPRDGAAVLGRHFPGEGHAAVFLTEVIGDLGRAEPRASVAVIARDPDSARRVHAALDQALSVRLVLDGDFSFAPGVDVTDVAQVKGLEFDYVVIPDASENRYPAVDISRRALHVAVTRAGTQLCVVSTGRRSPLLPPAD